MQCSRNVTKCKQCRGQKEVLKFELLALQRCFTAVEGRKEGRKSGNTERRGRKKEKGRKRKKRKIKENKEKERKKDQLVRDLENKLLYQYSFLSISGSSLSRVIAELNFPWPMKLGITINLSIHYPGHFWAEILRAQMCFTMLSLSH